MNYLLVRKIHMTVALVSSLFFLIVALSGVILNHSYSGYRPALAGDPPESGALPANQPDGAAQSQDFTLARYGPQGGGTGWNRGGVDVPAAGSQQPPAGAYARNPWKSLHTGRYLGLSSVVCDLTALALTVTVLTGLYLYFYGLRRGKC